jgi:hypothetical protein
MEASSIVMASDWPISSIDSTSAPESALFDCKHHVFSGDLPQVRILSSPLQNPGFPRVFRISGQLLWSSVAPMQLGAWRLRRCISRRAPKIESFFESRESPKHWGFACPRSGTDPHPWRR